MAMPESHTAPALSRLCGIFEIWFIFYDLFFFYVVIVITFRFGSSLFWWLSSIFYVIFIFKVVNVLRPYSLYRWSSDSSGLQQWYNISDFLHIALLITENMGPYRYYMIMLKGTMMTMIMGGGSALK